MALPGSGQISLSMIKTEFGRGNALSGYYGVVSGVPSSGALAFSHFYGKSNIVREPASGELYDAFNNYWASVVFDGSGAGDHDDTLSLNAYSPPFFVKYIPTGTTSYYDAATKSTYYRGTFRGRASWGISGTADYYGIYRLRQP